MILEALFSSPLFVSFPSWFTAKLSCGSDAGGHGDTKYFMARGYVSSSSWARLCDEGSGSSWWPEVSFSDGHRETGRIVKRCTLEQPCRCTLLRGVRRLASRRASDHESCCCQLRLCWGLDWNETGVQIPLIPIETNALCKDACDHFAPWDHLHEMGFWSDVIFNGNARPRSRWPQFRFPPLSMGLL